MQPILIQYYENGLKEGSILHLCQITAFAKDHMNHVRLFNPIDEKCHMCMILLYDSPVRDEKLEEKARRDWLDVEDDFFDYLKDKGYKLYAIHGSAVLEIYDETEITLDFSNVDSIQC